MLLKDCSSVENIQALSFCAPNHLWLWLAGVSCIANMIYLLCTVQWHLQSILLPGTVCILNEIIHLFHLPFPCIWNEPLPQCSYVGVALLGAEYSQSQMPWMNLSCRTGDHWVPSEMGSLGAALTLIEEWGMRGSEWESATSRVEMAHFHHSLLTLAFELCRDPRCHSGGKSSFGESGTT